MKQMIYSKCVKYIDVIGVLDVPLRRRQYIDVIGALDVPLRRRRTFAFIFISIDQMRQINVHCFQYFQVLLGALHQVRRVESGSA